LGCPLAERRERNPDREKVQTLGISVSGVFSALQSVFGGMIAASFLGIFLIPVLYVVFQQFRERIKRTKAA
jgi:HAE1 family hydrophobic/amphiphilic exporter-1